MRRLVFLTGTRADWGKLRPLVHATLEAHGFDAEVFATGMHLDEAHGYTFNEVAGSARCRVHPLITHDGSGRMEEALASTVAGFSRYVRARRPDLIVVHGDRCEALAGSTVGALTNTLVAHVEGGELSGTVDESIRHAVTKLAHVHFASNDQARARLEQLGEAPESIHVIGSPDLDVMSSKTLPTIGEVRRRYDLPDGPYGILVWHPVTTEGRDKLRTDTELIVDAIERSHLGWVVIYPCNDHGHEVILDVYRRRLPKLTGVKLLPSMRFEHMLTCIDGASVVVGNSSMGIRECPYYGVPSIDIGTRQQDRDRAESVQHIEDPLPLGAAIEASSHERFGPSTLYGDGKSAARFITALRGERLWGTPLQKRLRVRHEDIGDHPGARREQGHTAQESGTVRG